MTQNVTLYDFVYQDIVTDIYMGRLKNGDKLPTLQQMCEKYSIGRNTARAVVQLLLENEYILRTNKKQLLIHFNFETPDIRQKYLADLARRREAVYDVYFSLALVMPDVAVFCIQNCKEEERHKLAELCLNAVGKEVQSELNLFMKLFELYRFAIALSNNNMLISMFESMYQFIMLPLTTGTRSSAAFRLILPLLRMFLLGFKRFIVNQNYKALKRQLVHLCISCGKRSDDYLARICAGVNSEPKSQFTWIIRYNQEFLYSFVILDILLKILSKEYKNGDFLPSYARLAQIYNVSEKTSRKAVAVLDNLKIVQISNGKRTQITIERIGQFEHLLKEPFVFYSLVDCMEALQIMTMICRPIALKAIQEAREKCICEYKSRMEERTFTLETLIVPFLSIINSPCIHTICERLQKNMAWGHFLDFFQDNKGVYDIDDSVEKLYQLLLSGNNLKFLDEFQKVYIEIFQKIKKHVNGLHL